MALTVAQYLVQPFFGEGELPKEALSLIAAVFISGLTWLNCYSMKITTRLQNLFMVTKVLALTLVVIVGIVALFQGTFYRVPGFFFALAKNERSKDFCNPRNAVFPTLIEKFLF